MSWDRTRADSRDNRWTLTDLRGRTTADEPDAQHGTKDQKVEGSSPSERARAEAGSQLGTGLLGAPHGNAYSNRDSRAGLVALVEPVTQRHASYTLPRKCQARPVAFATCSSRVR